MIGKAASYSLFGAAITKVREGRFSIERCIIIGKPYPREGKEGACLVGRRDKGFVGWMTTRVVSIPWSGFGAWNMRRVCRLRPLLKRG